MKVRGRRDLLSALPDSPHEARAGEARLMFLRRMASFFTTLTSVFTTA